MRRSGVPVEQRQLPIGDAVWVARSRQGLLCIRSRRQQPAWLLLA
jgi:hypothetical protein